ncbi:MAG TPA: hypothetical protein VN715_06375 [Roseiarcus sp.]|nr:hypothetical protein [Roseiarcus sp.]
MIPGLPRFRETRLGESPDGYLVEGGRVTPISHLAEAIEGPASPAEPHLPAEVLAQIRAIEDAMPALRAIANIERVHANMRPSLFPPLVAKIDDSAHRLATTDIQVAAFDEAERALSFRG